MLDPDWSTRLRDELGWLATALGEVRDADVLTGRLRAQIRELPDVDARPAAALLRRLAVEREEARGRLLQVLDSDRYVALLEDLARAASDPPLVLPAPVAATAERVDGRLIGTSPTAETDGSDTPADSGAAGAATLRLADPLAPAAPVANGGPPPPDDTASPPPAPPAGGADPAPHVTASPPPGPPAAGADPPVAPHLTAVLTSGPDDGPSPVRTAGPAAPRSAMDEAAHFPILRSVDAIPLGERVAAEVLPALVRRPWKHLQEAVNALGDDPPDEALHQVRIRAKRMRYAAEAVAGVIGKPARRLAGAVAEVQGVLGDMQDAVVAETWLRRRAGSGSAGQALVAGQLVTLERQKQAASRTGWQKPWKAASDKDLRAWFKR